MTRRRTNGPGCLSALLLVAAAVIAGCRRDEAELMNFAAGDAEMNAAIEEALASVDRFIAALNKPSATQTYFAVKRPYEAADGSQVHVWIAVDRYDGVVFHGTINNAPPDASGIALGDRVTLGPGEISDWMIIDGGRLVGGYTIRVIRARLTPEEREALDEKLGIR